MQNVGTGMLEDGIFSTGSWLKSSAQPGDGGQVHQAASLQGWIYCRDHWPSASTITLQDGPTLPKGHQTWMMNEINKLVWPADTRRHRRS